MVCRSNLKGVGIAISMYLEDHDHIMPDLHTHTGNTNGHLWWDSGGAALRAGDEHAYWGIAFIDYAREQKLFGCPAFRNFCDMIAEELLYGGDDKLIYTSAFTMNGWLTKENTLRMPRPRR